MRWGYRTRPKRDRARELRRKQTPAERRVWRIVRGRRLLDLKFRRQHPIGGFIVDFYCADLRLVIEVEGMLHGDPARMAADQERRAILEGLGLTVAGIRNDAVSQAHLHDIVTAVRAARTSP